MIGVLARLGGTRADVASDRPSAPWPMLARLALRSPFYRLSLGRRRGVALATKLVDSWDGDPARGQAIVQGGFPFAGQTVPIDSRVWEAAGAPAGYRAALHGFEWLRDLRAVGSAAALGRARELTGDWLMRQARWDPISWRPDVLAARLAAWLVHFGWLTDGAPPGLRLRLLDELQAETCHLGRVARFAPPGALRLASAGRWLLAAVVLGLPERTRARAVRLLVTELSRQVHPDGSHIERSASVQLSLARVLIELRDGLAAARAEMPPALLVAIDRLAPFLRFLRHGDGGFALFNDTNEEDPATIDLVLAKVGAGKAPTAAPHAKFQRLQTQRSLLLVDAGPPPAVDGHAHAGTLSFEFSIGKERLIVNCGAGDRADWRRVQRATAAHSTLTVDDTNSSEILDQAGPVAGTLGHRPRQVTCSPREADGNQWLDLSHDGYVRQFGLVHHRRLFLAASGDDLRGEDRLAVAEGAAAPAGSRFAIRFHLHPRVQAQMLQDGSAVLLRLPSGMGWRLRAAGGTIALADSIYLGRRGEMKRAQQVVIAGAVEPGIQVKWALRREGKPAD